MRQEVRVGCSCWGKNTLWDDGPGRLPGVKGGEGVELTDFIIVLFPSFEAATDAMETRSDIRPRECELGK